MKKTKILIPAMSVLALGMAAAVTGTVAWFSANNVVNASGMHMQSTTPASLVIGKTVADIQNKLRSVDLQSETTVLSPATDAGDAGGEDGQLHYVVNGEDVNPETGLADEGKTLNITGTPQNGTHYVDYQVYLASAGNAITAADAKKITVNLDFTDLSGNALTEDTVQAMSIAFYVHAAGTDAIGNFVAGSTLNKAGLDCATNDGTATRTSAVLFQTSGNGGIEIPTYSGGTAVRIDMRAYLDGALLKEAGQAFVYTNSIDITAVNVLATFTLSDVA